MTWSELSLHRWLAKRAKPAELVGSQGHDAAVLRQRGERPVLCVDACVEGVHFSSKDPLAQVGRKAASRVLSDLGACGANPRALLLALRAPAEWRERDLRALIKAVDRQGRSFGAPLVGGDTTLAPGPLALTVTGFGGLPGRRKPVGRDRARPGQVVLLTGPVGGSLLGRHLRFTPRVEEGSFFARLGATAMMDVSDGLALDLARIAAASGVRIVVEPLPIHPDARRRSRSTGRSPEEHALTDGEDHELIVVLPKAIWERSQSTVARRFPQVSVLGRVERGQGVDFEACLGEQTDLLRRLADPNAGGWSHGS